MLISETICLKNPEQAKYNFGQEYKRQLKGFDSCSNFGNFNYLNNYNQRISCTGISLY
jgi:hypothetical protein